jgi:3'(2'), 5'-bisphosphate nucleotidase
MSSLSSLSDASFCESVEAGHSDHGTNARIAAILGITKSSTRMDSQVSAQVCFAAQSVGRRKTDAETTEADPLSPDSQAKYCSIARGDGDIYLRLPVSETYQEKIWVRLNTSRLSLPR